MDVAGVPSPRMDWDASNLPEAWRKFKLHVNLMFSGPFKEKSEEEKCSYLLLWIGDKGRDVYNTWTLTEEERKVLKTYYDRFQAYVEPKVNVIFARYMFHQKVQGATEPFEQFLTELRLLVKDCSYNNSEEMVRDRVVFGIYSPKVREKLLSVGSDLTLDKALDIARSHGMAQAQLRSFANSGSASSREQGVHAVSRHTSKGAAWKSRADWTKRKQAQYPRNPQGGDRPLQIVWILRKQSSQRERHLPSKRKAIQDLQQVEPFCKGIGLFPGECTIHLDPKAIPVVHPPRRVPIALRKRLKMELQNMEKQQVIIKVTEPTEWVNSMVAAEKPRTGKLRVCLDPKDLNKAIKRPHYPSSCC
ncbi:uncharacterized protein LOC130521067 isoform X1 [Takifugu flavidus]|uniref:uncharacterized protein LOC130521067 isoform X1 n=1 Tax=Takifugu flavidus TaxID=433684 RepID=UPI0025442A40|nr:uncharacterized protein LOC130521067 isoform X1 [Takifugu flavidus]XP_056880705.1 uncharacterized protein LOC130521067 isoform X1 [Takifugu flavidus]